MYAKKPTFLTSTITALVLCGLSTYPVMANPSNAQPLKLNENNSNTKLNTEVNRDRAENAKPPVPEERRVGIVNSVTDNTVELRLADGSSQTFNVNPDVMRRTKSSQQASLNLRRGTFVKLDVDNNNQVTAVRPAEVEKTTSGVITNINGDLVTLRLPNGETTTTIVAPAVATRMHLAPGVPLMVTSYRGISATKLCLGRKTTPPPIGGGQVPPVRALW